jgi:calcineurin-like phosphoesterase family protein
MNRRLFLRNTTMASFAFALPQISTAFAGKLKQAVKLGLITDLHQDIMHDGYKRLSVFVGQVKKQKPDAIIQMGDFAYPKPENASVIELFNQAHEKSLHILGNHDTDAGYTKTQCLEVWGMPTPYYSANIQGIKLIILDGNEQGSPTHKGGYASYIGPDQIVWLTKELESTEDPVLILSHQPLAGTIAVDNEKEVQDLLSQHSDKILLCVNGHSHIDQHLNIGNVNYLHVNSASYYWVGEKYKHAVYTEQIIEHHPYIAMTCPYEDSLFTFVTIDPKKMTVTVEGRKSSWEGESPDELGFQIPGNPQLNRYIMPEIQNRKIS